MLGAPLADRMDDLPLIVCGPILRRTDTEAVTVWIALRKPRTVLLEVYAQTPAGETGETLMSGSADTIKVGENLHILAITAKGKKLAWGGRYLYDLFFADQAGVPDKAGVGNLFALPHGTRTGVLAATDALAKACLTYPGGPKWPSFVLPPDEAAAGGAPPLQRLRIVHGSCRKAHGPGTDALPVLDQIIEASLAPGAPDPRPHMLLLTGDQIYADDVADALLEMLIDAGQALIGWAPAAENEVLPGPGRRTEFARAIGLSAMIGVLDPLLKSEAAKSHLMRFSEFAAMYLFAWSDVLWPAEADIPTLGQVFGDLPAEDRDERAAHFAEEVHQLKGYRAGLPNVRRAFANIPVYMIFDDHEVTDDWNLHRGWVSDVYQQGNVGGRRHVLNGLLAYALFQGWGNTPAQFDLGNPNSPGVRLLEAVANWDGKPGPDENAIFASLNIPLYNKDVRVDARAYEDTLRWHYDIQTPGFQCLVLDTRTMRGFSARGRYDPPDLLTDAGFQRQIREAPIPSKPADMTLVVSTTNVISEPLTETIVDLGGRLQSVRMDSGDAWTTQTEASERLIVELAHRTAKSSEPLRRIRFAIATGDIHYGFAVRGQYWAPGGGYRPAGAGWGDGNPLEVVFAEFTASSFRNESGQTKLLHNHGFGTIFDVQFLSQLMTASWLGWRTRPTRKEVVVAKEKPSEEEILEPLSPKTFVLRKLRNRRIRRRQKFLARTPALLPADGLPEGSIIRRAPDWSYRLDFMRDATPMLSAPSTPAATAADQARANQAKALGAAHEEKVRTGAGRIIVGHNNIGELTFEWGDAKAMVQRLWWRTHAGGPALPLTTYRVPLDYQDAAFPKPTYPGAR